MKSSAESMPHSSWSMAVCVSICYLITVRQFCNDIIFVMIQSVLHGSGSLLLLLHCWLYYRLRTPKWRPCWRQWRQRAGRRANFTAIRMQLLFLCFSAYLSNADSNKMRRKWIKARSDQTEWALQQQKIARINRYHGGKRNQSRYALLIVGWAVHWRWSGVENWCISVANRGWLDWKAEV